MKRMMILALLAVACVGLCGSGAMAAKLICVSNQDLKGETSVGKCLGKGMEFAIFDANGFARILSAREIELTRRVNPKALETPGFGLQYFRMAPDIPPLPVNPEIQ